MKKLLFLFLLLFPLALSATALKPSPYFVHDMEVHFFDLYARTMNMDAPSKLAVNGVFTPYYYAADLFFEGVLGLEKHEPNQKLSEIVQKKTVFSWMAGMAFLFMGDGHPDNQFPASNQNISNTFLLGGAMYSKDFYLRAGFIYGAYALKDRVYDEATGSYQNALDYFNYDSSTFQTGSGWDRLTNPDATYTRLLLEMESDLGFVVLKLLSVLGFDLEKPAYTFFSSTFYPLALDDKTYSFTPYVSHTRDVEGEEDFGITQVGMDQKIYFYKRFFRSSLGDYSDIYTKLNINYTYAPSTDVAPGKKVWFIENELVWSILGIYTAYNTENEKLGLGLGLIMEDEKKGDLWIRFKYNPYIPIPLYLRDISANDWSIEMGYRINFSSVFY